MSVIIRLQGLAWNASAMDIRQFFKGMTIPAGGVHIIGGEKGDAFIAFSSDEDARQAMMLNMGYICDCQVLLYLSSKTEMQTIISEARQGPSDPPDLLSSQAKSVAKDASFSGHEESQYGTNRFSDSSFMQQQADNMDRETLGNKDRNRFHGSAGSMPQDMNRFGSFMDANIQQHQNLSFHPNREGIIPPNGRQIPSQENLNKNRSLEVGDLKTKNLQQPHEKAPFGMDVGKLNQRQPPVSNAQMGIHSNQRPPMDQKNIDSRKSSDKQFPTENIRADGRDRQQFPPFNDPRFSRNQDRDPRTDPGFPLGSNPNFQPNRRLPPNNDQPNRPEDRHNPRFPPSSGQEYRPPGRSDPRFASKDGDKFDPTFPSDPRMFEQDKLKDRGRSQEQNQFATGADNRGPDKSFRPLDHQHGPPKQMFPPGLPNQQFDQACPVLKNFQRHGKKPDVNMPEDNSDTRDDSQFNIEAEPVQFLQRLIESDTGEMDSKAKQGSQQDQKQSREHEISKGPNRHQPNVFQDPSFLGNKVDSNKTNTFPDAPDRQNQMTGFGFLPRNDMPQNQKPPFQPHFRPDLNRMPGPQFTLPHGEAPFMLNKDQPPFTKGNDQPPLSLDRMRPPFMEVDQAPLSHDRTQEGAQPPLSRDGIRPPNTRDRPPSLMEGDQPPLSRDRIRPPNMRDQPPTLMEGDQPSLSHDKNQPPNMRDRPQLPLKEGHELPFARDGDHPPFMRDRDHPPGDGDQQHFPREKGMPPPMRDRGRPPSRRDRDRDQPPFMKDREQPPSMRDRDQPPFIKDREQLPTMGGCDRPPFIKDREQLPAMGGRDQPPFIKDREQLPTMGGRDPPPFINDREQLPTMGGRDPPPFINDREQLPTMGGRDQPPFIKDREQLPTMGGRDPPPFINDQEQLSTMGGRDQPPFMRDREQPSSRNRENTSFLKDRERDRPPFMRDGDRGPPFMSQGERNKPPFMTEGGRNQQPFIRDRDRPPFMRDGESQQFMRDSEFGQRHNEPHADGRYVEQENLEMDIDRRDMPPGLFQESGPPFREGFQSFPGQQPHSDFPPFETGDDDPGYRFNQRPDRPHEPFRLPPGVHPFNEQDRFENQGSNLPTRFDDGNFIRPVDFMDKPADMHDDFDDRIQHGQDNDFRSRGTDNPMDVGNNAKMANQFNEGNPIQQSRSERDRERGRDGERARNREQDRDRDRSRGDRDRDRERNRDRDRERDRDKERGRDRERERDRDRNRDKDRDRNRDKDRKSSRGRDRGRDRDRDGGREERDREKERDRDRNKDRDSRTGDRRTRREDRVSDQESRGLGDNRSNIDRQTGPEDQQNNSRHGNTTNGGTTNSEQFDNSTSEHIDMPTPFMRQEPRHFNQNVGQNTADSTHFNPGRGLLGDAPPGITPIPLKSLTDMSFSPSNQFTAMNTRSFPHQDMNFQQGPVNPNMQRPPFRNDPVGPRDHNFQEHSSPMDNMETQRGTKRPYQNNEEITVFVKGLPLTSGYRDIRRFFAGCEIPRDGLKISNDMYGNRNGEAYVKFFNSGSYRDALSRSNRFLFRNRIEVMPCSLEEFEKAVDSYIPDSPGPEPKAAQTNSNESDKSETSSQEKRLKRNAQLADSKTTTSTLTKSSASKTSSSSSTLVTTASTDVAESDKPKPGQKTHSKAGLVLQVKGLPLQVTKEELKKFFSDMKIANKGDSIYIDCDIKGRCTGVAYVIFDMLRDLKKALALDSQKLADRTIRITMGSTNDVDEVVKRRKEFLIAKDVAKDKTTKTVDECKSSNSTGKVETKSRSDTPAKAEVSTSTKSGVLKKPEKREHPSEPKSQNKNENDAKLALSGNADKSVAGDGNSKVAYYCVHLKGLPQFVTIRDIRDFFQGLEIVSRGVHFIQTPSGRPGGECFAEFVTKIDCEKAVKHDQKILGKNKITVKPVSKSEMIERIKQSKPNPSSGKVEAGFGNSKSETLLVGGPSSGGGRCCYVKTQNLPFSVTIGEIVNLFEGYSPLPETVRVQFSGDGQIGVSTAVVGFRTKEDAEKAIAGLNNKIYRNKQIELKASLI